MQQTIKQIDRSLTRAKRGQSALSCVFQEGDLGCAFSLDGPFLFWADLVGTMLLLFFLYWFLSFPFSTNKLYKSRSSFVHLEGFLVQESFFTDMQPVR